jgi:formamidopyrimidine-DNA glycosylase
MPELPEVETIARGLRQRLPGLVISSVRCRFTGVIVADAGCFRRSLRGAAVEGVARHGKYLFLRLSGGLDVAVHLRMTGQVLLLPRRMLPDRHTHLEVFFRGSGDKLVFRDVRKFGRCELLTGGIGRFVREKRLGPDALTVKSGHLWSRLQGTRRGLKAALLDQGVLAGLGNIYTDEVLFRCRLSPLRPAAALTRRQTERLTETIHELLREAIRRKGTSISDYVDPQGARGGFQHVLMVYGREGSPCPRCGAAIVKSRVAGRGTWSCPHCQQG